jgi:hypothetical protein
MNSMQTGITFVKHLGSWLVGCLLHGGLWLLIRVVNLSFSIASLRRIIIIICGKNFKFSLISVMIPGTKRIFGSLGLNEMEACLNWILVAINNWLIISVHYYCSPLCNSSIIILSQLLMYPRLFCARFARASLYMPALPTTSLASPCRCLALCSW